MRIPFLLSSMFFMGILAASAQDNVGIGTVTPHPNALLDISSTNKGLLVPRLNTLQRVGMNPLPSAQGLTGRLAHQARTGRPGHQARTGQQGHQERTEQPDRQAQTGQPGHQVLTGQQGHQEQTGQQGHQERTGRPGHQAQTGQQGHQERTGLLDRPGRPDLMGRQMHGHCWAMPAPILPPTILGLPMRRPFPSERQRLRGYMWPQAETWA